MRGHAWIARLLEDALLVRIVRGSCALACRRGREAHFAVVAGHGQSSAGRYFIQRGFSKAYYYGIMVLYQKMTKIQRRKHRYSIRKMITECRHKINEFLLRENNFDRSK